MVRCFAVPQPLGWLGISLHVAIDSIGVTSVGCSTFYSDAGRLEPACAVRDHNAPSDLRQLAVSGFISATATSQPALVRVVGRTARTRAGRRSMRPSCLLRGFAGGGSRPTRLTPPLFFCFLGVFVLLHIHCGKMKFASAGRRSFIQA